MKITALENDHWPKVAEIYQQGIDTKLATFETKVPSWNIWNAKHFKHSRLIALFNKEIVGWAALSPVSDRCVYGGVAEVSIYIEAMYRGQSIAKSLFQKLIASSEKNGIWTLQSQTFSSNQASVSLHKKMGFKEVGVRSKLGKLDDIWIDIVLMERRSEIIGT